MHGLHKGGWRRRAAWAQSVRLIRSSLDEVTRRGAWNGNRGYDECTVCTHARMRGWRQVYGVKVPQEKITVENIVSGRLLTRMRSYERNTQFRAAKVASVKHPEERQRLLTNMKAAFRGQRMFKPAGLYKFTFPQRRFIKGQFTDPVTGISLPPGATVSVLGTSKDDRSKFTVCYKDQHIDMPHQLTQAPQPPHHY